MKNVYQVGEMVRVLDAQSIEGIFGLDSTGKFKTPHGIVDQMTKQLGEIAKVKEINSDEIGEYVTLEGCDTWRWDISLIRRINPCTGDIVRFKSWKQMVEEYGEDAIWLDTYGAKMLKLGDTNFNYNNMEYLCGREYKVISAGEGSSSRIHIGLDWYITSDMVMVVERDVKKLGDIAVGQPLPEEFIYKPKLISQMVEDAQQSLIQQTPQSIDFTPYVQPKVELLNSPKQVVILDGVIEFNGFSIRGKELQIKF